MNENLKERGGGCMGRRGVWGVKEWGGEVCTGGEDIRISVGDAIKFLNIIFCLCAFVNIYLF